jgi:hypothetical protein
MSLQRAQEQNLGLLYWWSPCGGTPGRGAGGDGWNFKKQKNKLSRCKQAKFLSLKKLAIPIDHPKWKKIAEAIEPREAEFVEIIDPLNLSRLSRDFCVWWSPSGHGGSAVAAALRGERGPAEEIMARKGATATAELGGYKVVELSNGPNRAEVRVDSNGRADYLSESWIVICMDLGFQPSVYLSI